MGEGIDAGAGDFESEQEFGWGVGVVESGWRADCGAGGWVIDEQLFFVDEDSLRRRVECGGRGGRDDGSV